MECFETKFAPVPVSTTPLPFPFRVFSPLKGLILCTQTSRVEGHHQVTPTRPPRICHFGVLPETWSFPDSARNLTLKFLGAIFHLLILQISWQKFLYIYIYIYIYIYTRNSWPFAWYAIVYVYAWEIVLLELSLELLPFFLFFFWSFLDLPNVLYAAWIIITWNSWLEEFRVNFLFFCFSIVVFCWKVGKNYSRFWNFEHSAVLFEAWLKLIAVNHWQVLAGYINLLVKKIVKCKNN